MVKYRKESMEVEAFQYDGDFINSMGESYVPGWAIDALQNFTMQIGSFDFNDNPGNLYIHTPTGNVLVNMGDFIIRDEHGVIYPCNPDIFQRTYEAVNL